MNTLEYDFAHYLAAKKAVDDVALNRAVLDTLKANMPQAAAQSFLQVLELGSGIGTMVERMVEWGLLKRADYTAVDASEVLADKACSRLDRWSLDHLFVSRTGIPVLIEVKRASDTRLRREVVGQLLDYADLRELVCAPSRLRERLLHTQTVDCVPERQCCIIGKRIEARERIELREIGARVTGATEPPGGEEVDSHPDRGPEEIEKQEG